MHKNIQQKLDAIPADKLKEIFAKMWRLGSKIDKQVQLTTEETVYFAQNIEIVVAYYSITGDYWKKKDKELQEYYEEMLHPDADNAAQQMEEDRWYDDWSRTYGN